MGAPILPHFLYSCPLETDPAAQTQRPVSVRKHGTDPMTNADRYKEMMGRYLKGDFDGVREFVHQDVETDNAAPSNTAISGSRSGADAFLEYMKTSYETCEFEFMKWHAAFEEDDHVVALGRERFRILATNKVAETPFANESRWRDGKLVFFREYYDTAGLRDAYIP